MTDVTRDDSALLDRARTGDERAFRSLVQPHERELRAFCYRMSGALDDVDDLLQEILLRAWRGLSSFEGRSSLRTWLYRVAWSACADALERRPPRALSVEEGGPPSDPRAPLPPPRAEGWIGPCPSSIYRDEAPTPEARTTTRESVALAFLAALQLLPPKQRAALIARDVLGWSAEECAQMLDASVASVKSALQRARETLDARASRWRPSLPDEPTTQKLLERYVAAWENADVGALASLLHEEATLAMPPLPMWFRGPQAIAEAIGTMVLTPEARGLFRLLRTEANGLPAFAFYRRAADGSSFEASALHVVSLSGDRVDAITAFLDPALFPLFGLETRLRI